VDVEATSGEAAAEFGTILAWFYVADRTQLIAPGTKARKGREGGCHVGRAGSGKADGAGRESAGSSDERRDLHPPALLSRLVLLLQTYTRDLFIFIFVVLTAVAGGYTLKQHRALLLHRTQTEEWKGWMQVPRGRCNCQAGRDKAADASRAGQLVSAQASAVPTCPPLPLPPLQVLFLLYHYFNAKEVYNAIRVFIAAYVWMTGFGGKRGRCSDDYAGRCGLPLVPAATQATSHITTARPTLVSAVSAR
jgi:hypothetical protein